MERWEETSKEKLPSGYKDEGEKHSFFQEDPENICTHVWQRWRSRLSNSIL